MPHYCSDLISVYESTVCTLSDPIVILHRRRHSLSIHVVSYIRL